MSFESKLLYLKDQISGKATSVNLYKELKAKKKPPLEFYKQLVLSGWGKNIPIDKVNIYSFKDNESKKTILLESQKKIKERKSLFNLGINERENSIIYVLSINHYLADEQTLKLFINLIKNGIDFSMEKSIIEAKKMKQNYDNYVKKQIEYSISNNKVESGCKPIKLSKEGALNWESQKDRITVSREVSSQFDISQITYYLIDVLKNENTFSSGNTICTSKLWSSLYHYDCLGMVTGLVPINISEYSINSRQVNGVSLETRAFKDKFYKEVLESCLSSELFINTEVTRNLSSEYILDTTFPVGVEIEYRSKNIVKIEFEGRFYSENAVECILDKIEMTLKGVGCNEK